MENPQDKKGHKTLALALKQQNIYIYITQHLTEFLSQRCKKTWLSATVS